MRTIERGEFMRVGVAERCAIAALIAFFTLLPFLNQAFTLAASAAAGALAVLAWRNRWRAATPLGAFAAVCMLLFALRAPSQLVFMIGLLCYYWAWRACAGSHGAPDWMRLGVYTREAALITFAAALASAGILVAWYLTVRPDIADLVATFVPHWPTPWLIAGGLVFALVNAAVEEGAFRGVLMDALDRVLGPIGAVLAQAAAFGALHIHGFPRGWIGVGLAFVFGAALGALRRRSGGMLAPWLAHVLVDLVIVGVVLLLAQSS